MSTCFFNQTDISGVAAERSRQVQLSSDSIKYLVLVSDESWLHLQLFGYSLSCDTSGSLQLLVFGSGVLGSRQAPTLVTHGCVCLMGFYCLENAKERVTANLFNA